MRTVSSPMARLWQLTCLAAVLIGFSGCSAGQPDEHYSYACPAPLIFDGVYWEMPTIGGVLPLDPPLGQAKTAGCQNEYGETLPPVDVQVHTVAGVSQRIAVAVVADGRQHLFVTDALTPSQRCTVRFVACPQQ